MKKPPNNLISIVVVASVTTLVSSSAFTQDPSDDLQRWLARSGALVSDDVARSLRVEIEDGVRTARNNPALGPGLSADALNRAVANYMDANLNRPRHPQFGAYLAEEVRPGGLSATFPTQYPVLDLTASFDMTGVQLNAEQIAFPPAKRKKLLLSIGQSIVYTRGGGRDDCRFEIQAVAGTHYAKTCPEQ